MYCRMCGKLLDDTDRHCRYCGAVTGFQVIPEQAQKPIEEEVVFNPPYVSDERQDSFQMKEEETQPEEKAWENLKGFISENQIEDQKKKEVDGTGEPATVKSTEFTWNVHEFPKTKKTDDIEFKWELDEYGNKEQKAVDSAVFEEELFQEIRDETNRNKESNIDRFFTFSKKNEEFQELLDKEYEKFNRRPETMAKATEAVSEDEILETVITETVSEDEIPEIVVTETADVVSEAEIPKIEEVIPEMLITGSAHTIQETEIPEEVDSISETEIPEEAERILDAEMPETIAAIPKAEHLQEMSQARASFFGADLIQDNETIKKKLEAPETIEEEAPVQETTLEELPRQEFDNIEEVPQEAATVTVSEAPATKVPEALHAFNYTEMEEEEVDEKERRRNRIGMTVLVIVGIILVLEISILGIRYFAPKSGAAEAINTTQSGFSDIVTGWFDSISEKISGNDSNDGVKQDESDTKQQKEDLSTAQQQPGDTEKGAPAPDPTPMADKAALVATQLGNNVNIQQVKANDTIAYQEGKDYGLADINQSKPIANNVWMTPQGADPVYYDRSIVGTIIAFDSQWIDYVSGSSKSILDLLKKDSKAYVNTVGYPKVGKVQETFKLLEIGEIRQGSQGFYVWAHEEIRLTEKGNTTDRRYNWIYYLEPADGKMNIVNYFQFK